MKKYILILFPLFVVIMLSFLLSCSNDDEPYAEPTPKTFFEIEKVSYNVSAEAQTFDVRIHTNIKVNPQVMSDASTWISVVNPQQSEDEYLIYQLSVKENTDDKERIGNVVFMPVAGTIVTDDSVISGNTVVITQAGATP